MQSDNLFIVLEGADGTGKTTQAQHLLQHLEARARTLGRPAPVGFREPGGTELGGEVRKLLMAGLDGINMASETLLFLASRAALVPRVLEALEAGRDVVMDRFVHSTLAYQGIGRGQPIDTVSSLCHFATGGLSADLTILLDGDKAAQRLAGRDSTEQWTFEVQSFQERVRQAYLDLRDPQSPAWLAWGEALPMHLVDADQSEETVTQACLSLIDLHRPIQLGTLPQPALGHGIFPHR